MLSCNENIKNVNINDYEGSHNVGDKLNCVLKKGNVIDYLIAEIGDT